MNSHPIDQFLKDIFVNSVFQCCAKVLQSISFIFYTRFCKFTFCAPLVHSFQAEIEYCLNDNKAILSSSCPLYPYCCCTVCTVVTSVRLPVYLSMCVLM